MTYALLALIAAVAFTAEGAIGFGATVITVSLGAQLVPLDVLLPAWVPLNLAMSTFLVLRNRQHIAWRFLLVDIVPIVAAGTAVGILLFHLPNKTLFAAILGAFVAALALLQLLRPATRPLARAWQYVFLAIGGVAHGLFGSGGPMIVYVARRRLPDAAAFRATLCLLWFVLNIALVVNYSALGLFTETTGTYSLVIAALLVPGVFLGNKLHYALSPTTFERCVWIGLFVAGLALAVRSALAL
jgi:uncharacterized membrane protein YfcA